MVFDEKGTPTVAVHRERRLTAKEAWDLWTEVYRRQDVGSEGLEAFRARTAMNRTVAAWLTVRQHAILAKVIDPRSEIGTGTAVSLLDLAPADFDELVRGPGSAGPAIDYEDSSSGRRRPYGEWSLRALVKVDHGLPLHPRLITSRDQRERFAWMTRRIAEELAIDNGTARLPDLGGEEGLELLLEPGAMDQMWPSPIEMQRFENDLVDVVTGMLLKGRSRETILAYLRETFGLRRPDAATLLDSLFAQALPAMQVDDETRRQVFIGELETLIEQARDIEDHVTLRQYMRLKAKAIGIDHTDSDNVQGVAGAVFGFINAVADEREERLAAIAPPRDGDGAGRLLDVTTTTLDEDDDA